VLLYIHIHIHIHVHIHALDWRQTHPRARALPLGGHPGAWRSTGCPPPPSHQPCLAPASCPVLWGGVASGPEPMVQDYQRATMLDLRGVRMRDAAGDETSACLSRLMSKLAYAQNKKPHNKEIGEKYRSTPHHGQIQMCAKSEQ